MLFILYYNLSSIKNYLLRLDLKNKRKLIYYVKKVLKTYKEDINEKQRVLPKPTLPSNRRKR